MKKWLGSISLLLLCLFSMAFANSSTFEEGKNYVKLNRVKEPNVVVKIYSVYCPYCYKYEQSVTPGLIKFLPEGTHFESWSLSTKGKYGEQANQVISVLTLNVKSEVVTKTKLAYYKAIHTDKKEFRSGDEFIDFGLNVAGMTRAQFNELVDKSDAVQLRERWDQAIELAKIQGVPAFLINNQYLIKTQTITSLSMFNQLVTFLLTQ